MIADRTSYLDAEPVETLDDHALDGIRRAVVAFRSGKMLIVTDDDDREDEGDLIMAASLCQPEDMAFIIRHTSGIVCTPLSVSIAERLELPPMTDRNDAPHATAFTVSVDARDGTTTGISAGDRSLTVQRLAEAQASAGDFVRPGHVFPLVARPGGVLEREGHTEAGYDLCRMAGLPEVAVICELMNPEDGTVMRGEALRRFRERHGLMQISIAEMIAARKAVSLLGNRRAGPAV
ncbi:MAG: 3,4-dihydroxy-2-butanone-4-phosphate synthase [Pseudomonadota bacterium]